MESEKKGKDYVRLYKRDSIVPPDDHHRVESSKTAISVSLKLFQTRLIVMLFAVIGGESESESLEWQIALRIKEGITKR